MSAPSHFAWGKAAALAGDPAGKIEPSVVSDGAGAAKVAETEGFELNR